MGFLNFLKNLPANASKGVAWVLHVLTNTQAVITTISKLGPGTVAAVLAVFYDVMKFVLSESAKIGQDVATKQYTAIIGDVLSVDTQTQIAKLVADFQAGEAVVVADFHALAIAVTTGNAPQSTGGAPGTIAAALTSSTAAK